MKNFRFIAGLVIFLLFIMVFPSMVLTFVKNFYFQTTRPGMNLVYETSLWVVNIARAGQLAAENKILRADFGRLQRQYVEQKELAIENERLRKLLDFRQRLSVSMRKTVACQIIGRTPTAWSEAIFLDKGRAEGIEPGMPVLTEAGLVGKVSEVSPHEAKAMLVTHPTFRVAAVIQKGRHSGVVFGTMDGECRMKYISMDADVQIGDAIETAGFSKYFPKGILIGTIDAIWKEPGQIYRVASIRLAADMNRLEEVLCVVT